MLEHRLDDNYDGRSADRCLCSLINHQRPACHPDLCDCSATPTAYYHPEIIRFRVLGRTNFKYDKLVRDPAPAECEHIRSVVCELPEVHRFHGLHANGSLL